MLVLAMQFSRSAADAKAPAELESSMSRRVARTAHPENGTADDQCTNWEMVVS
jgi:hypothetical protein